MIYHRGSIKQFFKGDPTLKGCWSFEQGAVDESGNNNHGTINGAVSVIGRFGKCLRFNGSDNYVNVPHNSSLNMSGGISMLAWFKTGGTNDYSGIVQKFLDSNNTGWGLSYNNNGNLRADFGNGSVYINVGSSGIDVRDNRWHFACATYDGSNAKIYIDGKLRGLISGSGYLTNNTRNLTFGEDSDGGFDRYFNGYIDEIAIFSRALSSDEIFAYYKWSIGARNKSIFIIDVPSVVTVTSARRRLLLSTY
jgi:hypothetical protein